MLSKNLFAHISKGIGALSVKFNEEVLIPLS
jgi:hypothetical protein